MYVVVRVLGAFPYKSVKGVFKLGWWGCLYASVILVYVIIDFWSFILYKLPPVADTPLYLVICEKFSTVMAALLPIINHHGNTPLVNSIYGRIGELDAVMKYIDLKPKDEHPYRLTWILFLSRFVSLMIEGDFDRGLSRLISGIIMFCIMFGLVFRINHDIRMLCTRLKALNSELVRLRSTCDANKLRRLQILCRCHRNICQISETMNHMYSYQVLLLFSCLSLHNISQLYAVTVRNDHFEDYAVTGLVVVNVEMFAVIIMACSTAADEARRFNKELYKLMVHCDRLCYSYDHTLRIHLLANWKVVFTAGGIFEVDYSVFHSIVGATATYVMMLMQYGVARKPPPFDKNHPPPPPPPGSLF